MATIMDKALAVSGPFNVQHIPRTRTIDIINSNSNNQESATSAATTTPNMRYSISSDNSEAFAANAIVVSIHPFAAEYDNELSCSQGDVFKLVDPKITNGWVLAQSLSTGAKGWVPKDCLKVLDLFNNNTAGTLINPSLKRSISIKSKKSKKHSKSSSFGSSNSVLEYYTTPMTPCTSSSTPSSETSPLKLAPRLPEIKDDTPEPLDTTLSALSFTYSSVFAHSMYFLDSSATSYWYRIDLIFTQNTNQKLHLCRYYTDLVTLDKFITSQCKVFKIDIKMPSLPTPFNFSDNDISFTDHLHGIDQYLKQLFIILGQQPKDSPLIPTFLKFCQPMENDFEHYVHLDDDQIMKILRPETNISNNDDIELVLDEPPKTPSIDEQELRDKRDNYDDFLFTAPKLKTSPSLSSLNSKTSSTTSNSSSFKNNQTIFVKIKIIFKDEFSMIKLSGDELNFDNLSQAISDKLNLYSSFPLNGAQRFTLAYRNNNGIFILLRDDNGLKKSLLINNRKIVVKVI